MKTILLKVVCGLTFSFYLFTFAWMVRAAKAVVVRKSVDREVVRVRVPPSALKLI